MKSYDKKLTISMPRHHGRDHYKLQLELYKLLTTPGYKLHIQLPILKGENQDD